jgi:hypothetical protein
MFPISRRTTSAETALSSKKLWNHRAAMARMNHSQHRATRGRAVCVPLKRTSLRGGPVGHRTLHGVPAPAGSLAWFRGGPIAFLAAPARPTPAPSDYVDLG